MQHWITITASVLYDASSKN